MRRAGVGQVKRVIGVLMTAFWFSLPPADSAAAEPEAAAVVKKSLDALYYAGDDMRAQVSMRLINPQGKERKRDMTMLRKNLPGDEQRYFIYFHAPADVKGTALMVWKYLEREDDRWIFIPAIKLVRRIAADDKRSSFVGSDFTYEDVSGRNVADEVHALLRVEELNGRPTYVSESHPKEKTDYVRRLSWIDRERWLPLQEEYFDIRDERLRLFTADEVKEVQGHWTVTRRVMNDVRSGHRTEVVFHGVQYGIGLTEDLFSERYLRRPPARWIQ